MIDVINNVIENCEREREKNEIEVRNGYDIVGNYTYPPNYI